MATLNYRYGGQIYSIDEGYPYNPQNYGTARLNVKVGNNQTAKFGLTTDPNATSYSPLAVKVNGDTCRIGQVSSIEYQSGQTPVRKNSTMISSTTGAKTTESLTRKSTYSTLTRESIYSVIEKTVTTATLTRNSTYSTVYKTVTTATLTRSSTSGYSGTATASRRHYNISGTMSEINSPYVKTGVTQSITNSRITVSAASKKTTTFSGTNEANVKNSLQTCANQFYNDLNLTSESYRRDTGYKTYTKTADFKIGNGTERDSGKKTIANSQSVNGSTSYTTLASSWVAAFTHASTSTPRRTVTLNSTRTYSVYTKFNIQNRTSGTTITALTRSSISGYGTREDVDHYLIRESIYGYGTATEVDHYLTRSSEYSYATRESTYYNYGTFISETLHNINR